MAQEVAANVVNHAAAGCVRVQLWVSDSALELRVSDKGRDMERAGAKRSGGYGLIGMRERTVIGVANGGGTLLALTLPARWPALRAPTDNTGWSPPMPPGSVARSISSPVPVQSGDAHVAPRHRRS